MPKILVSHENIGGCLKYWRMLKILASHENLVGYTKYRRLVNIYACDKTLAGVKISAPNQDIGGKVLRPLTIWARQNLQLLTSSWSC